MRQGLIFDEQIAGNPRYPALAAVNAVSDILGPGRLSRCVSAAIRGQFAADCTTGVVEVEASHDQRFPGTPASIGSLAMAAGQSMAVDIPSAWLGGFVRLRVSTAVDGGGFSAWASGRR